MGGVAMFFALASLGLPGLGNFVGEFLVLLGTYQRSVPLAVVASLGLLVATVYSLWIIARVFQGPLAEGPAVADFSGREMTVMGVFMAALLWLGIYPSTALNVSRPSVNVLPGLIAAQQDEAPAILPPTTGQGDENR